MPAQEEVYEEINRLIGNAYNARRGLLQKALRMSLIKKILNIASGMLALAAGAVMSISIAGVMGSDLPNILAAIAAFISASSTLIATIAFDDKDIITTFQASSRFLALHEKACKLIVNNKMSDTVRDRNLNQLSQEYASLDEIFSKYYPDNFPIYQMTKEHADSMKWFQEVKALEKEVEMSK